MLADTTKMTAEPARAQLRANLTAYLRGQSSAVTKEEGYQTWNAPEGGQQLERASPNSKLLLVGDPVALMVRVSTSCAHTPQQKD